MDSIFTRYLPKKIRRPSVPPFSPSSTAIYYYYRPSLLPFSASPLVPSPPLPPSHLGFFFYFIVAEYDNLRSFTTLTFLFGVLLPTSCLVLLIRRVCLCTFDTVRSAPLRVHSKLLSLPTSAGRPLYLTPSPQLTLPLPTLLSRSPSSSPPYCCQCGATHCPSTGRKRNRVLLSDARKSRPDAALAAGLGFDATFLDCSSLTVFSHMRTLPLRCKSAWDIHNNKIHIGYNTIQYIGYT